MKYSMMTYSVSQQTPKGEQVDMPGICDLTVKMGLDAMDQVGLYGYTVDDIRKMAHDRGIQFVCYTQVFDMTQPAGPGRDAAIAKGKDAIGMAVKLGSPRVMLASGGRADITREEGRRNAIECLAAIVAEGKQAGITVTTEHFPQHMSPFIISDDVEEALQAVPDLRITFDNGNVATGDEDPVAAFRRHQNKTDFCHFKDWVVTEDGALGLSGKRYKPVLIGEGMIDYPALVKAMMKSGYAGHINLEYQSRDIPVAEALPRALNYLRELEAAAG